MISTSKKAKLRKLLRERFAVSPRNEQSNSVTIHDKPVVLLVHAKTLDAQKIIHPFTEKESIEIKNFDWTPEIGERQSCLMGNENLEWAIRFLDVCKDSVRMIVRKDYPLKLENDDFIVVIAPRIEVEVD